MGKPKKEQIDNLFIQARQMRSAEKSGFAADFGEPEGETEEDF